MHGYPERDFSELSDTELHDELTAQYELVEDGRRSRNPYYDDGPGRLRLAQLKKEARIRLVRNCILDDTRNARISREKAATHYGADKATYLAWAEWHDEQVKYWQAELERLTNS